MVCSSFLCMGWLCVRNSYFCASVCRVLEWFVPQALIISKKSSLQEEFMSYRRVSSKHWQGFSRVQSKNDFNWTLQNWSMNQVLWSVPTKANACTHNQAKMVFGSYLWALHIFRIIVCCSTIYFLSYRASIIFTQPSTYGNQWRSTNSYLLPLISHLYSTLKLNLTQPYILKE